MVVFRHGRPVNEALKIERLTLDDVKEAAREQGIEDLGAVKLTVLEPSGRFSFIRAEGAEEEAQRSPRDDRSAT